MNERGGVGEVVYIVSGGGGYGNVHIRASVLFVC